MSNDPLETRGEFSPEVLDRYFGAKSDAKAAMELKKLHPDVYARMRHAKLGNTRADDLRELLASKQAKPITPEELAARAEFTPDEVQRLLIAPTTGNENNLTRLKREHPEKYEQFRLAAKSYGVPLPEQAQRPAPHAKPARPEPIDQLIPELYCTEFNYKVGTKTTATAIAKMEAAHIEREVARRLAEAEHAKQTPPPDPATT